MVAVDAGANIGELSVRMASLVRASGQVVAVEPSPNTFAALVQNVKLNGLKNVHCECVAIGGKEELRTFYVERECHSLSSSMFALSRREAAATETSVTTIDLLCERLGRRRVDLIKLDIEGAELEAIAGSATILQSDHPPILIIEFNQEVATRAGWQFADLISTLRKYEYRPCFLNQNGALRDLDTSSIAPPSGVAKLDLIAVPNRNGRR
jgi:FkbM family methyltransferase